ncbi:MAG: XRE family transcriptional regulator [Candidatus Kapaibacterium sp.]|nr:MAG: XRE family transcriptional regulator [Candidatus Kapabacteria bacterium]
MCIVKIVLAFEQNFSYVCTFVFVQKLFFAQISPASPSETRRIAQHTCVPPRNTNFPKLYFSSSMNGSRLQLLRHAHGFSQREFAELLGISRRTLSTLEQSPEHLPIKYFARLQRLGIPLDKDDPPNVLPSARASPAFSPPSSSFDSPLVPPPNGFDISTLYDLDTALLLAENDGNADEEHEKRENANSNADIVSPVRSSPRPVLPPAPLVLHTVPGNLFRLLRQHLEITNARLVRLSGLKISDIEHAESGTTLVPPTLLEALVAAAEVPALTEPDACLAYLADALHKRTNEAEKASLAPPMPVLPSSNGKDAATIEAVHYRWAYDRVAAELNDLKAEHRDLSRLAAERLAKLHELERELDRFHVQQTLSDELGMQYADDLHEHKSRLNEEVKHQQDRFIAAKTNALEMLPAVMPLLSTLAQNMLSKQPASEASAHNFSPHFPPTNSQYYAHHHNSTPALHDPCGTGNCTPEYARQSAQPQATIARQPATSNVFREISQHQTHQHNEYEQTRLSPPLGTNEFAETIS